MGFLSGNIACTRFNVVSAPETLDFEAAAFRAIQPGSTITESAGFVPFELDEAYEIGHRKYAFRIRIDKVSADSTVVNERLRELIKVELDQGMRLGPRKKRKLKELAVQEVLAVTAPRSKVIEAIIDDHLLFVGSTAKGHLGTVLELLKKIGVEVEFKTPWLDASWEEDDNPIVDLKEPGQSIFGCRFLKALMNDEAFFVEPEKGTIKLATSGNTKVTLSGEVLGELDRYIEEGAEILSGKLLLGEMPLTFDGLSYRINSIKLEAIREDHWTETLDARLELLKGVWETFDEKFTKYLPVPEAAQNQTETPSAV